MSEVLYITNDNATDTVSDLQAVALDILKNHYSHILPLFENPSDLDTLAHLKQTVRRSGSKKKFALGELIAEETGEMEAVEQTFHDEIGYWLDCTNDIIRLATQSADHVLASNLGLLSTACTLLERVRTASLHVADAYNFRLSTCSIFDRCYPISTTATRSNERWIPVLNKLTAEFATMAREILASYVPRSFRISEDPDMEHPTEAQLLYARAKVDKYSEPLISVREADEVLNYTKNVALALQAVLFTAQGNPEQVVAKTRLDKIKEANKRTPVGSGKVISLTDRLTRHRK